MAQKQSDTPILSSTDRALDRFTELMIEKIQTLSSDWKKPWFTPGMAQAPRNLSGRNYNGGNSLMLMMQAEKMGYEVPVWGTFDRITGMNWKKDSGGERFPAMDENGNELPRVTVNKGEKSFPVFLTTFTVVGKESKEKIPYDDYRKLPREEQAKYNVYPKLQVYNVFNVAAQTNIREARPEFYEKLVSEARGEVQHQEGDMKSHPAIDMMIDENLFHCPIKQVKGNDAYYSISKDEIVVPLREQFVDGEAFASNTLHECAHATGAASRLDRLKPSSFGSQEYAREELTAELSAAVVASRFGLTKHVKNDSAAYLKSWLGSLQESPDYLKTVLADVKKATGMLCQRIEAIQMEMDKGEKADYGQFRVSAVTGPKADAAPDQQETEEKAAKESSQSYHRSR